MSVLDGPGEGTWSAFACKVVEQRDEAREELLRYRHKYEEARHVIRMILEADALRGHAYETDDEPSIYEMCRHVLGKEAK